MNPDSGFSVLLDARGKLCEVIEDAGGLFGPEDVGGLIATRIDRASAGKFFQFLAEVRGRKAAYSWEVNLVVDGKARAVFLTGVQSGERVLVVGAFSRDAVGRYLEELVAMNSEHTTYFRTLLRELSTEKREKIRALDELTEMNNQLVNLQRELQMKNKMLDQQSRVLEKLNEEKNRFLGMAAHDLRNPIGVIINLSGILLEDGDQSSPADIAEFSKIIHESGRFMLRMLEDLLDVSVIESGNLKLVSGTHNVVEVLRRNVEMNALLAREKDISLEFHAPCESFFVDLDRGKLDQVVNNLISNAIKFSERGSAVEVLLALEAKSVVVSVRDHGQGIPPEEVEGIFSEFVTTSAKSTEGEKSTGLGLMIAQKIIKAHGGRIWVESVLGEGTTFSISIPHDVDLGEEELNRLRELSPPEQDTDAEVFVADADNLEPVIVVSGTNEFAAALEKAYPGRFAMQTVTMAKDFLLMRAEDVDARAACIDCANLDMQLPVLLAFATRKGLKSRLLLCNFEPSMLSEQQLQEFGVEQTLAAGEPLEKLELNGDAG